MQASQNGYTKVVQLLVDHDADVNARAEVRFIYRIAIYSDIYPGVRSISCHWLQLYCTSARCMQACTCADIYISRMYYKIYIYIADFRHNRATCCSPM